MPVSGTRPFPAHAGPRRSGTGRFDHRIGTSRASVDTPRRRDLNTQSSIEGEVDIFVYLEIGTLKERQFTGISQVTAALAQEMLTDESINCLFFFGRTMVDNEIVEDILQERRGDLLEWHVSRRAGRPAPFAASGVHAGIFPNRKTCRRAFDFEAQIVHDLSTLLTPQFHNQDTVEYHAGSFEGDIASNDLTICVSEATRTDVLTYLQPVDPTTVVTVHNAASMPDIGDAEGELPNKPFVLILGTIEPRKNVEQVLSFLSESPSFADRFQFIFLGRYGWGTSVTDLVSRFGLESRFQAGGISFPGFVSEGRKNTLLKNAHLLIYPSLFEGYGLPVVEAMSMGVPCVTTSSSSMPEVGGDACFYFNPFVPGDFRRVVVDALVRIEQEGDSLRQVCKQQAQMFSWQSSYRKMMHEITTRAGRKT